MKTIRILFKLIVGLALFMIFGTTCFGVFTLPEGWVFWVPCFIITLIVIAYGIANPKYVEKFMEDFNS